MMPEINRAMVAVSSSPILSVLVKATFTVALALIGVRLARRNRAAVRHAVLAGAFGVLVALPVFSIVAPAVRIPVSVAANSSGTVRGIPAVATSLTQNSSNEANQTWWQSPTAFLFAGWLLGATVFLVPMAVGLRQVRMLRRTGLPWRQGQQILDRIAPDAGVHRRVEVMLHEGLPGPMTCGMVHPAIMLPADAQDWGTEDLNRAITHELEHVRRGDWLSQCFARAVCAVYWFHPLVWMAWRRLGLEAERSCDDAVLERSEATAYADQLVALARRLSAAAKTPLEKGHLLAMANRADLATRVGAVLDNRQRRGRAGRLSVAILCGTAVMLALAMSPLRIVAAPQATDANVRTSVRFLSNTKLVMVDVIVTDRNGGHPEGLSAGDFVIREDGVPQTITVFEFQKAAGVSSYYVIGYYSSNNKLDGQFRRIVTRLNSDPTARVEYRAGYYGRANGASPAGVGGDLAGPGDPGLTPPVVIYRKDPEYSEAARKAKYSGSVLLYLEVSASGQATNIKVIRSLGMGLDEKAIDAVREWRFKPGMKDGRPVTVPTQVEVSFRLL